MNFISLIIAIISLSVSLITFWLTRVRKGIIKMTRPTIIFFGPDGVGKSHKKVFIRTLLYSTSDKGKYIQNMFIRLQRGEAIQNFNVWVYDDKGLVRGSGLFINKNGIVSNHHFLMPKDGTGYEFLPGEYLLQVFVEAVDENPSKIFEQTLVVTTEQCDKMRAERAGMYFDWAPNTQTYFPHVDDKSKDKDELMSLVSNYIKEK